MTEPIKQTWQFRCVKQQDFDRAAADVANHRPFPASSWPEAVVGGYALMGTPPAYATIVRVDSGTVWVHLDNAPPRITATMTGVR